MTLVGKGSGGMEFQLTGAKALKLTREIPVSKQFHCF